MDTEQLNLFVPSYEIKFTGYFSLLHEYPVNKTF